METMQVDCDVKTDKDDSGCIQDDASGYRQISLLDLSDDVLLYILRLCSPRDLKALGYTCPRLGSLVQERSLWRHVDARNEAFSTARLQWYLTHMLHKETQELLFTGFAKDCEGCMGLVNTTRGVAEEDLKGQQPAYDPKSNDGVGTSGNTIAEDNISVLREMPFEIRRHHTRYFVNQRVVCLPRLRGCPSWSDDSGMGRSGPQDCIGPQFTLTPLIMRQLKHQCTLTTLSLEYCNINCNVINLSHFPKTLKKLSLRGTKFFNLIIDRSFLTKINQYLPVLEHIDLSECEWVEPSSLLPLSKHPQLTHLIARECHKLTEFVAYASLTARYGFRNLKVLDLSGSPVGDSEVAALGWLPTLEELWLSASRKPKLSRHAHYTDDVYVAHTQLDEWEEQEPEYYQGKSIPEPIESDGEASGSGHVHFDPDDAQPSTSKGGPAGSGVNEKDEKEKDNLKKRGRRDTEEKADEKDDDDDDDDDDDGNNDSKTHNPPKKLKRNREKKHDFRIHVETFSRRIRRPRQANPDANQDGENIAEMPLLPPSNLIVVAGSSDESPSEENAREQNHPVYCICPEHRSVQKTDKATETDNMDVFRVCDCHGPETANKSDEADNSDSQDKAESAGAAESEGGDEAAAICVEENSAAANPRADDNPENNDNARDRYVRFRRNQYPVFINYPGNPEILINRLLRNNERRAGNSERRAGNSERRAGNNEERDGNNERRVGNNEGGAGNSEGGAGNSDGIAGNSEGIAGNSEGRVGNSEGIAGTSAQELNRPEQGNPNAQDNPQRPQRFSDILRAFAAHLEGKSESAVNEFRNAGQLRENQDDNQDQNGSQNQNGSQKQDDNQRPNDEQNQNEKQNKSDKQKKNDKQKQNIKKDDQAQNYHHDIQNEPGPSNREARTKNPISARNPQLSSLMQRVENLAHLVPPERRNFQMPFPENPNQDLNPGIPPRNESVAARNPNLNLLVQNASPEIPENHAHFDNLPFQLPHAQPAPNMYHQGQREPFRRDVQYIVEPRHHVLYVSVGSQFNTFRFPRDHLETDRSLLETHIDSSALVTDFSIRRFGRADGEDVNFIHFGPHGPILMGNSVNNNRPDRSNLRVLSVTGYRNITDRSLSHLITAAPHLRRLDFSETNITESGVENFRSLRPDCDVVHSPFEEKKEE